MSSITILSKEEENKLLKVPKLQHFQRETLFQIPAHILDKVYTLENDNNKIIFILMYGYFKLTNRFYDINAYLQHDVESICEKYNLIDSNFKSDAILLRNLRRYKQSVKQYLGIKEYTDGIKAMLLSEATTLANNFTHRKKIFYSLIELSIKLKIEVPSYTELSRIITVAINSQKKVILEKLAPLMQDEKFNILDEFLKKDEGYHNRWHLTRYKILEHATKKNQMTLSLTKFTDIKSKFNSLKNIIKSIGLSPKVAEYHARWIEKSQVFQVKRKKDVESNFLLLSFVYYQYFIRNDNLIDRFISIIQTAKNSSLRSQKEFSFEQEPQKNRVMQSLEDANLSTLNDIESIVKDSNLSALKKVTAIENLLEKKTAVLKEILTEKKVFDTATDNKYDFIESKSASVQGKLSGVLKVIEFDEKASNKNWDL